MEHYKKSNDLICEESAGSMLPAWGEAQRHKNETFEKARELRRFIAANPGCKSAEMPEELRGHLSFLLKKKLVTWKFNDHKYYIITLDERIEKIKKYES